MAGRKKTETSLLVLPEEVGLPDISDILGLDIPTSQKRRKALTRLGLRKPKQKYSSVADRKAAAKERAKKRREEEKELLRKAGLETRPKVRRTIAEKRARRSDKSKEKRAFLKEAAALYPELAKLYGLKPKRGKGPDII